MGPGEAILRGVPGANGDAAPGRSKGNSERQLLFKGCKREKEGHQEMIDITYYDCLQTVHHREVCNEFCKAQDQPDELEGIFMRLMDFFGSIAF